MKKILVFLVSLFIFLFLIPDAYAQNLSQTEIFTWVAGQMEIKEEFPLPHIQYVSQEELGRIFLEYNKNFLKKMEETQGIEKTEKYKKNCLENLIGLFNPKTDNIYIGDFLSPCKKHSIMSHEITHYFQHKKEGIIDPEDIDADIKMIFRELQAYKIQEEFEKTFCE